MLNLEMENQGQLSLDLGHEFSENKNYLSKQLLTYIGNKRALLGNIGSALEKVKRRLDKDHLRVFDVFSGSGVVSRFLKAHASFLISNDIEDYAAVMSRCYLRNKSTINFSDLSEIVYDLNERVDMENFPPGFIEELYAPKDDKNITKNDRVFYTKINARRLDNYRRLMNNIPPEIRGILLGPLLSKASIHANTAGIFKGFYKNRNTKIGQFGGSGSDALSRIKKNIKLELPILSNYECEYLVLQEDANSAARHVKEIDLAYIDPPYNQHPYGSNYFMLNLLVQYKRPENISQVSGIPTNWQRSGYNVRQKSLALLQDLLNAIDASILLISFNNEGFIRPAEMHAMLAKVGSVDAMEIRYNAFRGCRNFKDRPIHVTEQLFLVEKK